MLIEFFAVFFMAIFIDLLLGELPSAIHPVVLMGKLTELFKNMFLTKSKNKNRILGIFMTFCIILILSTIFIVLLFFAKFNNFLFILIASILLSTTFSIKFLLKSVYEVYTNLKIDLNHGRNTVSYLVSRNTQNLSFSEVVSAAIETLTENITDSVIAPFFYFFISTFLAMIYLFLNHYSIFLPIFSLNQFLLVIVVVIGVSYRVVNTLDAMVGYKDSINIDIGWFPAKIDDCLNYIPARLTGILVMISSFLMRSNYKNSWKVMLKDARNTPSPNSGYPMAAAAGALNVQLEKPGTYSLGEKNEELTAKKIIEALKLTVVTISLFALLFFMISLLLITAVK